MQYSNAPISEVIFGITLKEPISNATDILDYYVHMLKKNYPIMELSNPLGDYVIHENDNVEIYVNADNTGQAIFRFRSSDKIFLIQIQKNKLYFNWIRNDSEPTGNYPGFSILFRNFQEILNGYFSFFNLSQDSIVSCDLTYHDRFDLKKTPKDILFFNIFRNNPINYGDKLLTYSVKLSEQIEDISSYSSTIVETVFSAETKILRFEHIIHSLNQLSLSYEDWFEEAHKKQLSSFEMTFSDKVLETWR